MREWSFNALAAGYSPQQIADIRKVSVKTALREIDSAIAERRLDAPERYAHLQVARPTKALPTYAKKSLYARNITPKHPSFFDCRLSRTIRRRGRHDRQPDSLRGGARERSALS